jgi:HAD superfamily hydrolase (TIGR01459 family)
MTAATPPRLTGLSQIADDYDALICDVWGVLHNGRESFAAAAQALIRFRQTRGPVVLLTNAPRRAPEVAAQLERLKVPAGAYDSIMSSGEATRAELERRAGGREPLALYHLGPERDRGVYEGLNVRLVDVAQAALILCTGLFDDDNETPDDYRPMLEAARTRGLLLVCANPDVVVQRGTQLLYCAGAIARLYAELGGKVLNFGKPYRPVYDAALAALARVKPATRVLVIGDGVETDIKGANDCGLDALLVTGGIHAELAHDEAALGVLLSKADARVCAVMPALSW